MEGAGVSEGQLFGRGGRLYRNPEEDQEAELPYKEPDQPEKWVSPIERERQEHAERKARSERLEAGKPKEKLKPSVVSIKTPPPEPKPRRDLREPVSTIAELGGIIALTAGFFMLAPWVGLVVLGLCLVILGVAMSPRWDRE